VFWNYWATEKSLDETRDMNFWNSIIRNLSSRFHLASSLLSTGCCGTYDLTIIEM
jgi:hypothetical protein